MAASNATTASFLFKRVYAKGYGDSADREHPLWYMLSKKDGFVGDDYRYVVRYGNPQGISGTLAGAQAGASSSKGKQFAASVKIKYGVCTIDGPAMKRCKDEGAFAELLKTEVDGSRREMIDTLAYDIYRDGTGVRGRRSSLAGDVVTLTLADDARNFKEGLLVAAGTATDGSGMRTGTTTVASLDEDAGTVTLTSAAGITGFANNDYLFRSGDQGGVCVEGLAKIIPTTAPSGGDSFRGVDRSAMPTRLAGSRLSSSETVEEAVQLLAVKISKLGKKADLCMLNPDRFYDLAKRTRSEVEYSGGALTISKGFAGFNLVTPAGTLRVVSDADCPTTLGYIINTKEIFLKHLDAVPHMIDDDGKTFDRSATADEIEGRWRSMSNLIVTDPACFGVVTFA